jgi:hypothetical protein
MGIVALTLLLASTARAAPTDPRELQAREDFATGKYDRALELFGRLYAETLHPTYLRNIGRCYQYLGDPEHALISFRDYLRKARGLDAAERQEVEGYIGEMEALRRRREEQASGQRLVTGPPPEVVDRPAPARPGSRWWIWALGGAVLAGTAVALGASGVLTRTDRPACPGDRVCP